MKQLTFQQREIVRLFLRMLLAKKDAETKAAAKPKHTTREVIN